MKLARRRRQAPDFSLATVNVVFLLLLFFLAVGTIVDPEEIEVAPPETSELPLDRLPRPLLVIRADGTMSLDGAAVSTSELSERAQASLAGGNDAPDFLNVLAPAGSRASPVMTPLLRLAADGVPVRLVTLRRLP